MYELVTIYQADIEPKQAEKAIGSLVGTLDGSVNSADWWGERRLTYPIKGRVIGNYCTYQVEVAPEKIKELQRLVSFEEEVLRARVYKVE
jgi:small subunit ribosomal protein S6